MNSNSLFLHQHEEYMTLSTEPEEQLEEVPNAFMSASNYEPIFEQSSYDQMPATYPSPEAAFAGAPYPFVHPNQFEPYFPPRQVLEPTVTVDVTGIYGPGSQGSEPPQVTGTLAAVTAVQETIGAGLCITSNDAPSVDLAWETSMDYHRLKKALPSKEGMDSLFSATISEQLALGFDASQDFVTDPSQSVSLVPGLGISYEEAQSLDRALAYLRVASGYQGHGRVWAIALITRSLDASLKVDLLPSQIDVEPTHAICVFHYHAYKDQRVVEGWRSLVLSPGALPPLDEPVPHMPVGKTMALILAERVQNGEVDFGEEVNGLLLAGELESIPRHLLDQVPVARALHDQSSVGQVSDSSSALVATSAPSSVTPSSHGPNDWNEPRPMPHLSSSDILTGRANLPFAQITGTLILHIALEYTNSEIYEHILPMVQRAGGTLIPNSITKRVTNALKSYVTREFGLKQGTQAFEQKYQAVRNSYDARRDASLKAHAKETHIGARNTGRKMSPAGHRGQAKKPSAGHGRKFVVDDDEEEEEEVSAMASDAEEDDDENDDEDDDLDLEDEYPVGYIPPPRRSARAASRRQVAAAEVMVGAEEDEDGNDNEDGGESDVSDWEG